MPDPGPITPAEHANPLASSQASEHADLRRRMAEALAAKFIHQGLPPELDDTDFETAATDRQMWRSFIADDGERDYVAVTCNEAAQVCAAVRDDKLVAALESIDDLNDLIRQERAIHVETIRRAEQAEAERDRLQQVIDRHDYGIMPVCEGYMAEQAKAANDRAEQAEAAIARVRRLSELTIDASCRAHAIDQARDTLAALDGPDAQRALLAALDGAGAVPEEQTPAVTIPGMLATARDIWRHRPPMTLPEIAVVLAKVTGDLAEHARANQEGWPADQADVAKELGNLILSAVRWADDLGLNPADCLAAAERAQREYVAAHPLAAPTGHVSSRAVSEEQNGDADG